MNEDSSSGEETGKLPHILRYCPLEPGEPVSWEECARCPLRPDPPLTQCSSSRGKPKPRPRGFWDQEVP